MLWTGISICPLRGVVTCSIVTSGLSSGIAKVWRTAGLVSQQVVAGTCCHNPLTIQYFSTPENTKEPIPLDIPDVTIEHVTTQRSGHMEIPVQSTLEGTPCHRCGTRTTPLYGAARELTLRQLPVLGRQTFIRLHPQRSPCLPCHGNPTTTQTRSWYTPRSSLTHA